MKKLIIVFISMFLILSGNIVVKAEELNEKIILIDPGHGGIDGGAISKNGTVEKEINLSIALKLRDSLEDKGYKVFMTRDSDIGLYENGKSIKEKKREDLKKRVSLKVKLIVIFLFLSMKTCFLKQNVLGHKYGMHLTLIVKD